MYALNMALITYMNRKSLRIRCCRPRVGLPRCRLHQLPNPSHRPPCFRRRVCSPHHSFCPYLTCERLPGRRRARAIGIFGGSGAVANVLGLIIGAIFVEYANWRWVFWFATIIALPVAAMCALLVPKQVATGDRIQPSREKLRRLDIPGVSTLTCALILFIFAVTSGSTAGWKSAMVLAPLFISVALIAAFLVWQTRVPEKYAAVYVLFLLLFSLPTGY
jgi:MFS family permease